MTVDQKVWLWFFRKAYSLFPNVKYAKTEANKALNEWRRAKKNVV